MEAQALATQEPRKLPTADKQHRLSRELSAALDHMVDEGKSYQDAAAESGLTCRAMRMALDRPHVIKELQRRKHVFRAAASSANISRLVELRDQGDNKMAAIAAIKVLEQMDETTPTSGIHRSAPGVTIIINGNAPVQAIEHQPVTIDNDPA